MSRGVSKLFGAERDLLCGGRSGFLLWWVPWLVFAVGFSVPGLRTALWTTSFVVMGTACFLNAARCGRVHCLFTGPFFIAAAIASLFYGLGFLPLGPSGWKWIGAATIIGACALTCIPELFLGRYRRGKDTTA
jgi:hypothetical protein